MKRIFALLCAVLFTSFTGIYAYGMSNHQSAGVKLSAREEKIVKAYLKTLETFDAKYLNSVKYPGITFQTDGLDEGVTVKILNPTFSKQKDLGLKLDRLDISGLLIVCSADKVALANITQGMAVKMLKKQIYAFQEVDVKTEEVKEISDLDEKTQTALKAFLTDLYGAETADLLLGNYMADSFSDEGGSNSGTEQTPSGTPTPTPSGK